MNYKGIVIDFFCGVSFVKFGSGYDMMFLLNFGEFAHEGVFVYSTKF